MVATIEGFHCIVISQCPYTPVANFSHLYRNVYQVLPEELNEVNSTLCGPLNRRGLLCSECEEAMALLHTDTLDSCVSNAPIQH